MNPKYLSIMIIGCFAAILLESCESNPQKISETFERVKKEKLLVDTKTINTPKAIFKKSVKIIPLKKVKNIDEWEKFKNEIEKKIVLNEAKIKEIKGIPDVNAKLLRQVKRSEKENNKLRDKMAAFNEEGKEKRDEFRAKMSQDVNVIDNDLKRMIIKNKV